MQPQSIVRGTLQVRRAHNSAQEIALTIWPESLNASRQQHWPCEAVSSPPGCSLTSLSLTCERLEVTMLEKEKWTAGKKPERCPCGPGLFLLSQVSLGLGEGEDSARPSLESGLLQRMSVLTSELRQGLWLKAPRGFLLQVNSWRGNGPAGIFLVSGKDFLWVNKF